jgi:hypothetical protein
MKFFCALVVVVLFCGSVVAAPFTYPSLPRSAFVYSLKPASGFQPEAGYLVDAVAFYCYIISYLIYYVEFNHYSLQ